MQIGYSGNRNCGINTKQSIHLPGASLSDGGAQFLIGCSSPSCRVSASMITSQLLQTKRIRMNMNAHKSLRSLNYPMKRSTDSGDVILSHDSKRSSSSQISGTHGNYLNLITASAPAADVSNYVHHHGCSV